MFSTDDTIVAVATPPGRGGIGIVRISGSSASTISDKLLHLDKPLQPRYATFARTEGDRRERTRGKEGLQSIALASDDLDLRISEVLTRAAESAIAPSSASRSPARPTVTAPTG